MKGFPTIRRALRRRYGDRTKIGKTDLRSVKAREARLDAAFDELDWEIEQAYRYPDWAAAGMAMMSRYRGVQR